MIRDLSVIEGAAFDSVAPDAFHVRRFGYYRSDD